MVKPKQYKALIVDLDGTCVRPGYDYMPNESVIKAISNLVKRGVPVSVATGRNINYAAPAIEALGLVDPCMLSNGAIIYDPQTKKALEHIDIPRPVAEQVLQIIESDKDKFIVCSMYEEYSFLQNGFKKDEIVGLYIQKITEKKAEEYSRMIGRIPGLTSHFGFSVIDGDSYFVTVNEARATKQRALQHLLHRLKIAAEEIVAVGDGENDLPMIIAAGMGVAMGNAGEGLKSVADYIAPSVDEDGVVHVIDKFFPEG